MPFANEFLVAISREWLSYIFAVTGRSRKCIVLDLDNTLWGGVLGESGALGVVLGPHYPGLAFQNFQRALLTMWERGIILAINSKNNLSDVTEVFATNPHMILREEHFAAVRANWEEKSENVRSLAAELNIGTDSMVFLDDSPLERELMTQALPEVLVPDFSVAPEEFVNVLYALNVFHQLSLTKEDAQKGIMYAQERRRREAQDTTQSKEEYIASLGITLAVSQNAPLHIPRVAQLTQKTNQFNLTTRRYVEGDIATRFEQDYVFDGEVTDKFGQYGIVIVAIVTVREDMAELDTFLMSCRAMGRSVEFAFLEHCLSVLHAKGISEIEAIFAPTAKNAPVADFLPAFGFTEVSQDDTTGKKRYTLDIGAYMEKQSKNKAKPALTLTHTP